MKKQQLILAENGSSAYRIYVPAAASECERFAAEELRSHLEAICGVSLPVVSSIGAGESEYLLWVGAPPAPREAETPVVLDGLASEGIVNAVRGGRIILTGASPRGVLYAVYRFLEEVLGVRWFAPELTHIPQKAFLAIDVFDDYRYSPAFEYRNCFVYNSLKFPLWAARNRMNAFGFGNAIDPAELGYASAHCPAGHSFYALVPPEEYFETHPEYFSLIDGKRNPHSQLCLSNPDVFEIVLKKLREQLKTAKTVGVSFAQNDWLGACQCPECSAVDAYHGSPSGSIIRFCNRLGEAIEGEFPDRLIQTYAYQYGQPAPKNIRVHKNVAVWLCSIEACFSHPHGSCGCVRRELKTPDGRVPKFAQDIADWGKICDNLFVWDYCTNFRNFLLPHPNLQVLGDNIRFFRDNRVRGVFEQQCTSSPHTEMQELRGYMIAKALWNPDCDTEQAQSEFLSAWFGAAGTAISQYIRLLQEAVREGGHHLLMSTMPRNPADIPNSVRSSLTSSWYETLVARGEQPPEFGLADFLNAETLARADELFDLAERLADDETVLRRVRIARLPLKFAAFSMLAPDDPRRLPLVDEFYDECMQYGVTEVKEGRILSVSRAASTENRVFY